MLCAAFFSAIACSNQPSANREQAKMEKTENKNEGAIFPKGEKAPAETFTRYRKGVL